MAEAAAAHPDDEQHRRREEEIERWMLEQEAQEEENEERAGEGAEAAGHLPEDDAEDAAAAPGEEGQRAAEEEPLLLPPPPPPISPQHRPSFSLLSYRPASLLAFVGLLYYALRTRRQYYLAAVYLSSSKWAYAVTGNAILALALIVFDGTVKLFLKGLRPHEAESLQDFVRWNVTETCLALTMFRHELAVATGLQFVALITVKCWHHVAAQREQHWRLTEEAVTGRWPYIRHIRLLLFLVFLQMLDLAALQHTVAHLMETGPTVGILFAFEAAIMLVSAWSHILLWHLHVVDSAINFGHDCEWKWACRLLHPWKECKATLTFAVELQAQAVQFIFYSTFFAIVLTYYGMPINLFREVYMSFARLKERLTAFLKYRHLMASMNRFQNATDDELEQAGRTCIICRDEMSTADCKRLPVCQHLFHKSCLREWLVQQQSCPTCRADIAAMEAQERARNAAAQAADERGVGAAAAGEGEAAAPGEPPAGEGEPQQEENAAAAPLLPTDDDSQQQPPPAEHPPSAAAHAASPPPPPPSLEPETTDLATTRSSSRLDKYKTMRFRPKLDFSPALYRVVARTGADVYAQSSLENGWPSPSLRIARTVEVDQLVLCRDQQSYQMPDGATVVLLHAPDGWIRDDAVEKVCELQRSESGQWVLGSNR